jgi:glycosyltransferase involved in cell wall biosynthesis
VPVTVVVPTLNEASQIADVVQSLTWAGEIIVADGGSQDGTPELARAAGARVLAGRWETIAAQRNAAIGAAAHEWVFALDADERVDPELAGAIAAVVAAPRHGAYCVRRRNVYLGRVMRYAGWGNDLVVRLFRRDQRFVERRVHEALQRQPDVGRLPGTLEHVPYRGISHHIEKVDRYATWAAQDLAAQGRRARLADLLLRPPLRFVRMYGLQLGVLEGWHGALLCGLAAVSVFLKYARLWDLRRERHA